MLRVLLWSLWLVHSGSRALAAITVGQQIPLGILSAVAPGATQLAAYNDTVLNPPPIPTPAPATSWGLSLQAANTSVPQGQLSIPIPGTFLGFSIEMSVITQLFGINSSFIQPPFLNLMSNIAQRSGAVHVRVGGNTQEYAYYVDSLPESRAIAKEKANTNNPTETPAVIYTTDFFYMLSNISSFSGVKWYIGVPFNDTTKFRFEIVEMGEAILGDNILGIQAGNEPDLYVAHKHRNKTYGPANYTDEIGQLIAAMAADDKIPVKNTLIGPSVSGTWSPEDVFDTGFITKYTDNLLALSVEHYPIDNCFPVYGISTYHDPQETFPSFLSHSAAQSLVKPYLNAASISQAAGKPFLMFETNSASCGGFPGISDSFGATLWALDYGLQMAYSNFSGAMLHVGGQNVYYNPFTAPPTNQSKFFEWTVGSIYYSALVSAEVFGKTNTAQIVDMFGNNASVYTPQYAIYENGALARVGLFNYMTDPSGANDYTASLSVAGGNVPASVQVKYLLSDSVSTKTNITWANQTLGTQRTVDGRFRGTENIITVPCDTTANTCAIRVPAPSFALVFFTADPLPAISTVTFATTAYTNLGATATVGKDVLATSNGMTGKTWLLGSTSKGQVAAATARPAVGAGRLITVWLLVMTGILLETWD
ncbi:glycoside hydrolase family 79 protein [Roridomyces roridus]|uniref:Glycoside hydrolase family 79 protein n=1 Tax=Roridomyces roridus TaxID=1738132 RepID=A0AAD7FHL9_9AGAR|nr:glycoside hydrolase family 79 protein [Roridomyces roridus]